MRWFQFTGVFVKYCEFRHTNAVVRIDGEQDADDKLVMCRCWKSKKVRPGHGCCAGYLPGAVGACLLATVLWQHSPARREALRGASWVHASVIVSNND